MKDAEPEPGELRRRAGRVQRLMSTWRVALCLLVVALAGCAATPRPLAHVAAAPRDGRTSADLEVVTGATTVTVGTASLGAELLRVSTPARSGVRPRLVARRRLLLYLDHTGGRGPAAVRILLNPAVTWRLQFAGGTSATSVDLGHGQVSGVEFTAGSSRITMKLPRPAGAALVVLADGASQARLSIPPGVPARLQLHGGAGFATIGGRTYTGVASGTVLDGPGWSQAAARYDIEARAGVSAISVSG